MGINEKLAIIQEKLKAPKTQFNKYGGYYYRSLSDILEGAKPLLKQLNATLTISDQIKQVGDKNYLEATVTLRDAESGESVSVTGYAREAEDKKGFDDSQITGAASSYARKYALNGLFCIDDTNDADSNEHAYTQLITLAKQKGVQISQICGAFGKQQVEDLTAQEFAAAVAKLNARQDKQ